MQLVLTSLVISDVRNEKCLDVHNRRISTERLVLGCSEDQFCKYVFCLKALDEIYKIQYYKIYFKIFERSDRFWTDSGEFLSIRDAIDGGESLRR